MRCMWSERIGWHPAGFTASTTTAAGSTPAPMDSSVVPQPGSYAAAFALSTDSPYSYTPIGVTMNVAPPKSWGKITGTVTSATTGGPVAGATVEIETDGGSGTVSYTVTTDAAGQYQQWLDASYSPLQVIVAEYVYQPQAKAVTIKKGKTTTANFALEPPAS